ncbi:MAG: glycogen synthase [Spirochaetia bacterium]
MMNIWQVAREYAGIAEAGGVKDVVRDISENLVKLENTVTVVLPFYGCVEQSDIEILPLGKDFTIESYENEFEPVSLWKGELKGVRLLFISSQRISEKRGVYTYTKEDESEDPNKSHGTGHLDFSRMNMLFQKAVVQAALTLEEKIDILHCHDSHCALVPVFAQERHEASQFFSETGFLVTIHNAGGAYHQAICGKEEVLAYTGLPEMVIEKGMLHNCLIPFLLAAEYSVLNTVSKYYAEEITKPILDDDHTQGVALEFYNRNILVRGITNGINTAVHNPKKLTILGNRYSFNPMEHDLVDKKRVKELVIKISQQQQVKGITVYGALHTESQNRPLFAFQGRVTRQKGIAALVHTIRELTCSGIDADFIIMGQGEPELEEAVINLIRSTDTSGVCFFWGYDNEVRKMLYAGSDFLIIPSEFEPCGLTDFTAQLFGTIPIVHGVGGLKKVIPGETGYAYPGKDGKGLSDTVKTAASDFLHNPEKLNQIRKNAITCIYAQYTWPKIVKEQYLPLYKELLRDKK